MLNSTPLNCLLYADDLVILSESKEGLQKSLDILSLYCEKWGLEVNTRKTKCLVFNTMGRLSPIKFKYKNLEIENTTSYTYLGVTFSASGSFTEAKNVLYKKSLKAFFKFSKYFTEYKPDISTLINIFNHTVQPVALYGSEIWGTFDTKKFNSNPYWYFEKLCHDNVLEKVNMKLCRFALSVNRYSTHLAVRGELGRYPLYLNILFSMIKYWKRVALSKDLLIQEAFQLSDNLAKQGKSSWVNCIYSLFKFLNPKVKY